MFQRIVDRLEAKSRIARAGFGIGAAIKGFCRKAEGLSFRFARIKGGVEKMAKKGAPGSAGRWGDDAWEEQNWDSVRKQEQMKQEVLIKASGNSERIRQMVRETEVTRSIGSETLQVLDQQSGEI